MCGQPALHGALVHFGHPIEDLPSSGPKLGIGANFRIPCPRKGVGHLGHSIADLPPTGVKLGLGANLWISCPAKGGWPENAERLI